MSIYYVINTFKDHKSLCLRWLTAATINIMKTFLLLDRLIKTAKNFN